MRAAADVVRFAFGALILCGWSMPATAAPPEGRSVGRRRSPAPFRARLERKVSQAVHDSLRSNPHMNHVRVDRKGLELVGEPGHARTLYPDGKHRHQETYYRVRGKAQVRAAKTTRPFTHGFTVYIAETALAGKRTPHGVPETIVAGMDGKLPYLLDAKHRESGR